jgi:hypothetical protein
MENLKLKNDIWTIFSEGKKKGAKKLIKEVKNYKSKK